MAGLRRFTTPASIRRAVALEKRAGKSVGFVPTMGALHDGHASLIRTARKQCDHVVVSVFVNPTQFGPDEDFDRYPRNLHNDAKVALAAGADGLFIPSTAAIYAEGCQTVVSVKHLSKLFEGAARPGHFDGVCTVVEKLLHCVQPDRLYLGQKDYQQCCVLKQMIADMLLPVEVRVCPIVRENDGLAMSSRNAYLTTAQRKAAAGIFASLKASVREARQGQRSVPRLERGLNQRLTALPGAQVDYACWVDAQTLQPLKRLQGRCVVLAAVKFGATRLIDNQILNVS